MADTVEVVIMEALFARLAALTFDPVLPIHWPNDPSFTPPSNQRYLRAQFVPNTAVRVRIGSEAPHQHLGLFQVSVNWTKGAGESDARNIAGAIAAHYPADLKLHREGITVRISKRPDVVDMIEGPSSVQIPVMIAWEVYA